MSDTNNIYTTITAPQLTDTKYGENLDTQFNNINSNFTKLGSGAFTKGDKGDSTKAYRLSITTDSRDIYDKNHYIEGILAQAIYVGLKRLLPENAFNYPIGSEPEINVTVIVNRVDNEDILKEFWTRYKNKRLPWEGSVVCHDHFKSNLIEVMPFFYIDKKFYSENLNIPKGEKDKTGIYTFNELSDRDGLIITFTQNNIQQSIYYDTNKETWCWALGNNETGIPIYQKTIDDKLLVPWGKDNTYHALYNTKGNDEGDSDVGRPNSLAISPCKQNPDGTWYAINLPGWPNEPDNPKTYPELKLDGYYLVHCRKLVGFTGYFTKLSSSICNLGNINTENITVSKTNTTNGNITIGGNLIVKAGKILNNSGSIESHAIWGDEVRGKTVEVASDGTLNVNKTATLNVNGKSTFNGNADFNGNATFKGNATFNHNMTISMGGTIYGGLTVDDVTIRPNSTVNINHNSVVNIDENVDTIYQRDSNLIIDDGAILNIKGECKMSILGQDPDDLQEFLIQVNNRLNALESKK